MDIATLAATAVAALTPYVKDAVEDFAGKAGEVALAKAKQLFSRLKEKFAGDGYAEGTLQRFEKDPEKYSERLEEVVTEVAESDLEFADEVEQLVKEIESAGPEIKVVQKIKVARGVVGVKVREMQSGRAEVKQDIEDAQNVTGFEAKHVGGGAPKRE
jgi:hypothetical protein